MYTYPKSVLTMPQLVQKLKDQGMDVVPEDNAEETLERIGYYRFRGYCYHLLNGTTHKYCTGTSFASIVSLYNFDTNLSNILMGYLSKVEVALRAYTLSALLSSSDPLIFNDPSMFSDKKDYWKNQSTIASEVARSSDVFIRHNFDKHDGAVPAWAVVEVLSFGTLSKIIKTIKTGSTGVFSLLAQHYRFISSNGGFVVPSKDMLTSWIQAATVLRNICAHNSRIYNRSISTRPTLLNADKVNPQPKFNGLYEILLALKYLRPTDDEWKSFIEDFKTLYNKYNSVVDLQRLNFPIDWESHFKV